VNHRDLNKGNNAVENLEYVTPAENTAHYFSNVGFNREAGFKPVLPEGGGPKKANATRR
jgi:hypothetical protein